METIHYKRGTINFRTNFIIMKKFYILLLFLAIQTTTAQVTLSAGADIVNAVVGSKPTNNQPKLNLFTSVKVTDPYSGFGLNVSFENFEAIEFKKYGFGIAKSFTEKNITYSAILELNSTIRYNSDKQHTSFGLLNQIEYRFYKSFAVGLTAQIQRRKDLDFYYNTSNSYRFSTFLTLNYKLK